MDAAGMATATRRPRAPSGAEPQAHAKVAEPIRESAISWPNRLKALIGVGGNGKMKKSKSATTADPSRNAAVA
jgi:hypothetical protein